MQITHHIPLFHIPNEDVLQCGYICEFPIENGVGGCATDEPKSLKIILELVCDKIGWRTSVGPCRK